MTQMGSILKRDEVVLVTGATGFIGAKVVQNLLNRGFSKVRCFVRPTSQASTKATLHKYSGHPEVQLFRGNLLSLQDCVAATKDVALVIHLAAGRGEKSFPDAFMNSVVTTRNLLDASLAHRSLKRFVNVSSFSVYTNTDKPRRDLLDEECPVERRPETRGEAYCFAKTKQDETVIAYGEEHRIPYVIVRPGIVYGAGNTAISGRVGIGTFGLFLHLGGSNLIPLTFVDNCADAIVLAGLTPGIENEVFNVVDDELPSSRQFLRLYKQNVKRFPSLYVPKIASYGLCRLWEKYYIWSEGQLPPAFNRSRWNAMWKKTNYKNDKLKTLLGWRPLVSTRDGLAAYFYACRAGASRA